jgi:ASC-1-like (ASCH) protein
LVFFICLGFALGKKNMSHTLSCQNPWFKFIQNKEKKVEGRAGPKYDNIKPGDKIQFECKENSCVANVIRVTRYPDFHALLSCEGLENVLPGVKTIEQGVKIYKGFYSEAFQSEYGVIAIEISKL